ncbi:MAG: dihydropteroate synthase, partial [Fibrobacterota bacterium]
MAENEYKPVEGLSIIGESINDSVPSTHELLEKNDIKAIKNLAVFQAEKGAAYIDVNIGRREPSLMAELIREIQSEISLPLSVDSPDPQILRAGLEAYDAEKANGKKPIVNSVSELRPEIFGLYSIQPFMPILMSSERAENGKKEQNKTGDDVYRTALNLKKAAEERCPGIENDDLIIDPGIAPIGTDFEKMLK